MIPFRNSTSALRRFLFSMFRSQSPMAATGSETGFELALHSQSSLRPKSFALTCGMRPHVGHG